MKTLPAKRVKKAASSFNPLQIADLLPVALRTLPLPLAVFVPQETRPVAHDRRLEVQRARQHVAVAAAATETPLGIERRWRR